MAAAVGRLMKGDSAKKAVVHLIRMEGVIQGSANGATNGRALNFKRFDKALAAAFEPKKGWWTDGAKPKLVALQVNSNGGSPVQSSLMHRRIRQLSKESGIPVVAFVEDAAASGGLYLACAADRIIVDGCSAVGSLGVVTGRAHFDKVLERWGLDVATMTTGKYKTLFDGTQPVKEEDLARVQRILGVMHQQFWDDVVAARGGRLFAGEGREAGDLKNPAVAESEVFIGHEAVEVGLADAVGTLHEVLPAEVGVAGMKDVKVVDLTPGPSWGWGNFGSPQAAASDMAASVADSFVTQAVSSMVAQVQATGSVAASAR